MIPIRTFLTGILFTISTYTNTFGQNIDKQFSVAQLQEDFQALRSRYENNLANLYLYTNKQKLDKYFDSLYTHIKPMTALEFYSYITPLSSLIKDGHSNIFISEQTTQYYNEQSKFFPFNIYWTENKMFITKNLSADTTIQIGTEILAINGIPAKEVMAYLLARQVRDGNTENYALWIVNSFFREYYSYHFGHEDTYTLLLKTAKNTTKEIRVSALSKEIISNNKAARYPQQIHDGDKYLYIDSTTHTAIFTFKTWDDKNLQKEIDIVFSQLQKKDIDNLIIDVRDNQGGNFKPAIYLLSYLLNEPFQYFNEIKSVSGHTDTSQVLKAITGKMLATNQVKKNPFSGKVYVLINGGCFSNTASFCSRLEYYNRAVFIGQETGGNKVVFSGVFGLKAKTVLPNTKITCDNANYQLTVTDISKNTGHGVFPTYAITPTINDIIEDKDVVLDAAFNLIKQK